jgi:predicted ATPase/DNA-binding CsgD family transcriptional regulator
VRLRAAPVTCPAFIGRVLERDACLRLLEQTKSGQGQIILICGEAGVGKSRLLTEVKTSAASQGYALLQGNCFQADRAFPYAPFLDLFRTRFADIFLPAKGQEQLPFARELARFLPDVAVLLPDYRFPLTGPSLDPAQTQRQLFTLLLRFFTAQATRQPLLFVIEDLHWSDETSLDLLAYLARRTMSLPILFTLTYRNDEISPELRRFLAELDRERLAHEFTLQPFTHSEAEAMLRAIFARRQTASSDLLERVYALSDGNPFFIEEVLKSLQITGEVAGADDAGERSASSGAPSRRPPIPRSVQDAVYQRTRRLSALAREALTLAAVAGRRFDLVVLQQVLQIEDSTLLTCMKELISAQLVTEEVAGRFSFRHALTREAVYAELLASERQGMHRALAEAIERHASSAAILDAELVDLAYHFYEGGVWSKAAEYGQRAGERALALYAPRAAVDHLTRALDALARQDAAPSASALRARGQAYEALGAFEQAKADCEKTLASAREQQNDLMEWQSLLDLGFLWAGRDYAQAGEWFQRALQRAQELGDAKLQAHSLNRLGNWLINIGHVADGLQAHQEALTIFTSLADQEGMAETVDLLGMANGIYGDTVQAVERFDQAIALLRTLHDRHRLVSSIATRMAFASPAWTETTWSVCEAPERCARDSAEALDLARQVDSPTAQAYAELNAGLVFASFGDLGRGLAHAQESLRIASEIQHAQWQAAAYITLGRVYLALLEDDLAAQACEAGLAQARELGSAWWAGNLSAYLAQAYLAQGNVARAEATLLAVVLPDQQPRNSAERRICWTWGELALARGNPALALDIAERLLNSIPGTATTQLVPRLLKLQGDALGALARHGEAVAALEEARRGALARHERLILWQIDRALGRQYRRLRQEELARRHFASAREVIASLADTFDDVALRERFLRAALSGIPREMPASPTRAAKAAYGGLTAREREVARQVALGRSNGEIAETLVVTKRTIETHLNNILYKLSLTSRAQLVVWAIEKGLASRADEV